MQRYHNYHDPSISEHIDVNHANILLVIYLLQGSQKPRSQGKSIGVPRQKTETLPWNPFSCFARYKQQKYDRWTM